MRYHRMRRGGYVLAAGCGVSVRQARYDVLSSLGAEGRMSMDYNRAAFARQRVWERFDSLESPKARRTREATERSSLPRSRPEGQRFAKLDPLLLSYSGDDARMLAIQGQRQRSEELSNSDQAWAYEMLRRMSQPQAHRRRRRGKP